MEMLVSQRKAYNAASIVKFGIKKNSIVELHAGFYRKFRDLHGDIPSQVVIAAENECLSAYRSIKSNKHKITKPIEKKKLSIRLDKRMYSYKVIDNKYLLSIISMDKRVKCHPFIYDKLQGFLNKKVFCDPLLFTVDNEIWISFTFNSTDEIVNKTSACGVDIGIRMAAVTSEGNFYQDKKFNKEKRKLRYLKRELQSKGTKSAKKHLKKLRRKERNKNRNQSHKLSNSILKDTKANVLVFEDLSGIKNKKNKWQNKNRISQVPFYQLKMITTYKAPFYGKTVISVNPAYTSQIDHRTNKKDGVRKGRRYYGKDSVILDSDWNAAINIAYRSKLPVSLNSDNRMRLDGQAFVNRLNVGR